MKETSNSYKIRPLDFEDKQYSSSTPENVPKNTNEHTCDYLRYVNLLIIYAEALFDFEGSSEKALLRKTVVADSLYACNFIKKWLQHRCFPVNFAKLSTTNSLQNICEMFFFFFWPCEYPRCNKVPYPCSREDIVEPF